MQVSDLSGIEPVTRNEAVRAQIRVMMADGARSPHEEGQPARPRLSPVADSSERPPAVGEARRPDATEEVRASRRPVPPPVTEEAGRLERLTTVAEAAERYRRAARKEGKHKGKKARKSTKRARKELFGALAAWSDSETRPH